MLTMFINASLILKGQEDSKITGQVQEHKRWKVIDGYLLRGKANLN